MASTDQHRTGQDNATDIGVPENFVREPYDREMEFVNIINTSLANDPEIGIRLPFHDVTQMCGGCRDGWVLAKLIDTWIPDVLDLGKLHGKPGGTEEIDLRAMTENNAIVQGIIKQFGCIATLCYELADIVKGAANIAGPLSEVIVREGSCRKIRRSAQDLKARKVYQALGNGLTYAQFLSLDELEIAQRWCNFHLKNAGHQQRFPLDNVPQRIETYLALLEELEPDPCPMEPEEFGDVWHSAAYVLAKADILQCRGVLTSTSLCAGEEVFHLAFIADLFVKYALRDFGRPTMEPKLQIPISGRNFRRAYEPLDENKKEIRLLFLGPALEGEDDIYAYLIHVDLEIGLLDVHRNAIGFEALSYVWGNVHPACQIYLDDQKIDIRPNLNAALKQLRSRGIHFVWVDALCINQSDIHEKNHQVPLMTSIYSKAREVILWLGVPANDSHLAMSLLSQWHSKLSNGGATGVAIPIIEFLRHVLSDEHYHAHWEALRHLLHRKYWSRLWIVQEVLVSTKATVLCGDNSIPWIGLEVLLCLTNSLQPFASAAAKKAIKTTLALELASIHLTQSQRAIQKMDLLDALVLGRQRFAQIGSDHVYAVLGFAELRGFANRASYEDSIMSLFYNTMRHIIEANGNLDILSACNNYNIEDQQCHDSKANTSNLFRVKRRPESVEVYMYAPKSSASYEGADPLSHLPQIVLNKVDLARILQKSPDRESLVEAFGSIHKHCIPLEDSDELNPLMESILETSKTLMGMIQSCNVPWPSWLPDWTFPLSRSCAISNRYLVLTNPQPKYYCAGGRFAPLVSYNTLPYIGISGVWFASVAQVAKDQFGFIDKEEGLTPGSDWVDIKSWYHRTTEPSSLYENEDAFERACFKLLTLGRIRNGEEYKCSPEVFNLSSQYRKDETNLGNDSKKAASTSLEHLNPPNDWYHLDHSIESFLWEFTVWPSRPFVTEQGHLGRGPLSSKEEDLICIFPGGKSPCILRDAGKNDYYFLGECYVEGVMEGEGLRPPYALREFLLR